MRNNKNTNKLKENKVMNIKEWKNKVDELFIEVGIHPEHTLTTGKTKYAVYTSPRKRQGYNARMDESLGMRRGASRTKKQSMKSRRDESKGMSKSMGRRAYASVRSMDRGRRTRR